MLETNVVVDNVKAFHDIYLTFNFYQFEWTNNAHEKYSSHLTRDFYSSYVATLMNFALNT